LRFFFYKLPLHGFYDSLFHIYVQVCYALFDVKQYYIKWPATLAEVQAASAGFSFPFSFGAIDGSHIDIKQPMDKLQDYTNRKMRTSVVLQAVCDSRMVFTDISTGWPGSLHDARIFKKSTLINRLENMSAELQPYHLLGDSAYALTTYLVVPFRDNGHLSQQQLRYNIQHSSSRTVIERAFARLKGKFRRLKYLDMSILRFVPIVITATCVLHNFIICNDVDDDDDDCADDDDDDDDDDNPPLQANVTSSATVKRNLLMAMLK
jgi:DDE superfamily endonuclease